MLDASAMPALVLNADFRALSVFPLSLMNWQDTITAVVKEHVTPLHFYDRYVSSPSTRLQIPSVVVMRDYVKLKHRVAFTRFNLFLRDRFQCQYCREHFEARDLTFEHVIPRSKGGTTSWTNIVAACEPCNTEKDNRDDMKPIRDPFVPTVGQLLAARKAYPKNYLHETWISFLYWNTELDP